MEPIEIRMDLENEWQYVWLRNLLDVFGQFKEMPDGSEKTRFVDWFESDDDGNVFYNVRILDTKLWWRYLNNSRLP